MKSYGQFCGLARALDLVGDRWSLLIVRELSTGPRRYGELRDGLPGIATNLLADRLRELEDHEVVDVDDDPSAKRYSLSERGHALKPALTALARWGGADMVRGQGDDVFRAPWLGLAAEAVLDGADLAGLPPLRVRAHLPEGTVDIVIEEGRVGADPVQTAAPDVTITASADAVLEVLTGRVTPGQVGRRPGCSMAGGRSGVRALAEVGRRSGMA